MKESNARKKENTKTDRHTEDNKQQTSALRKRMQEHELKNIMGENKS